MLFTNISSVKWHPRKQGMERWVKEGNRLEGKARQSVGKWRWEAEAVLLTDTWRAILTFPIDENLWSWWLLMCLSNVLTPLRMFPGEIELDDHPFSFLASMDFMNPMEQPIRSYRPISRMFACLPLFLEMTSSQLKKKKKKPLLYTYLSLLFLTING